MTDSKTERLGRESIPRLVLRFASTTLVALVLHSVYTLLDALFVSWGVGVDAMGGVSIVFPFVVLQGAIATAVGSGAASLVSRRLGEGKPGEAGEITLNAMLVFYGTAILTTVLGFIFMEPLLGTLGVTGELHTYAKQYFIIILAGNVFSTGFSNIIRAEGKMRYALLIWVIPVTLNTILDAIFIFVLGMGVRGSALGTVIGQFVSCCMSILFFTRFSSQKFRGARFRLKRVGEVLAIGLPSLVQMGSLSIMAALLNNVLSNAGGTLGINAFACINKSMTFALVPFTAITQALSPIVGYSYGLGKIDRVRKTIRFCLLISFAYAIAALFLVEAIPGLLMRIFTDNTEVIALGVDGLRIIAVALLFLPLPMLAGAAFQAMGQKTRAFLMYAANLVFLIPAALLMARFFGLAGVWWAYVVASVFACGLGVSQLRFLFHQKSLNSGA